MIEIPLSRVSPDVLRGIIEEFVLREGTDYGLQEYSLDQKVAMVLKQLEQGKAYLAYDEKSETCTIAVK
jgi:hypothetical protein